MLHGTLAHGEGARMEASDVPDHAAVVNRLRTAGCVFAEEEADLLLAEAKSGTDLNALLERRAGGVPLEHVLGWAEFCGRRIEVDPGVFVPRRRTEFLVRQAAAVCRPGAVVLDLCCGSGALGTVVAELVLGVELHASDLDPQAVECARRNVAAVRGQVYSGDLYDPLPVSLRGRLDVVIANVPYVPTEAVGRMPTEARVHEARVALDGGADGLDVLRRVASAAPSWLAPGGHLLMETSQQQAASALGALTRTGLRASLARSDEMDATVVIGRRPGPPG